MKEETNFLGKIMKFFGHKHRYLSSSVVTITGNGQPTKYLYSGTIVCKPSFFTFSVPARKIKLPKEKWRQKIRLEALEEIIKKVDKRNDHNQKLAYYDRVTLLKELEELKITPNEENEKSKEDSKDSEY